MYASRSLFSGRIFVVGLCVSLMSGASIFGASISYPGIYHGTEIDYSSIRETSMTDPGVPLYGAPSIFGTNLLRFGDEMDFSSYATGAGGIDVTNSTLRVRMDAIPGAMRFVQINEIGSYGIAGAGGTSATQVSDACEGISVTVTGIDGAAVAGPTVIGSMKYKLITGSVTLPIEGIIPDGPGVTSLSWPITDHGSGTWVGTAFVDLTSALASTVWRGHDVTQAWLTFDNTLTAQSEVGTVAFINKQQLYITPEPGTFVLLSIAALLGLGGYAWRKRHNSL